MKKVSLNLEEYFYVICPILHKKPILKNFLEPTVSNSIINNEDCNIDLLVGPITEINLPIDSNTKQLKGFGIVTYLMPEHAVKAFNDLDGTILHGRMLHLIPGKSKDTPDLEGNIF